MNLVNFTTKYKFTILLTLIALLVFCLGIFVIKKYIYPRTRNMEGVANNSHIYFFNSLKIKCPCSKRLR